MVFFGAVNDWEGGVWSLGIIPFPDRPRLPPRRGDWTCAQRRVPHFPQGVDSLGCHSMMPILSHGFWLTMITTPLPSWSGITSPPSAACSDNSREAILPLADDLAQETFLRAYKNIRSFRGEAKFSTWLYRIAYNCFREEARKRKELVGIDETQLEAEQDPQTVDPALKHDLMHALQLLPLHERSAILLCCQNGLSHDEAARVLDIPLGTVKTNVLRGREKLKKTLAAWGPN